MPRKRRNMYCNIEANILPLELALSVSPLILTHAHGAINCFWLVTSHFTAE